MSDNEQLFQEYAKQYGQVVAKAWADDDFKTRLLQDPAAVLSEEGLPLPQGIEIRAVENTDKVLYLTLPPKPSEELSDDQLSSVAGGATTSTAATAGSGGCLSCPFSTASSIGSAGTAGSAG